MHTEADVQAPGRPASARAVPLVGTRDQELRWLADGGLIEPADDGAPAATWRGGRWRISAESFARWIVDTRKWEDFSSHGGERQHDTTERTERIARMREQIREKRRRLSHRLEQAAKFGPGTEPHILIEIEDLEREIADIERQIREQ